MAGRRPLSVVIAVVVAVVAVLAIPVTRRLIGAALIAALTLGGCEVTVGSYTKRHCDAFENAFRTRDPAVGRELLALSTPPEGEDVERGVHDAAVLLAGALLGDAPEDVEADFEEALLAECAKVTE